MFVRGDPVGSTFKNIGETSTDIECANLVRKKAPNANAAVWASSKNCWVHFRVIGIIDNNIYWILEFRFIINIDVQ